MSATALRSTLSCDELTSRDESRPALRHVFHLAGEVVDVPLDELTPEAIAEEQGGKLGGAWALHDALDRCGAELESFVLYGSAAGFLGNYGQSAYSAANAGLTGLVRPAACQGTAGDDHSLGRVGRCRNWLRLPTAEAQLRRRGAASMQPELCLLGLERALQEGREELAVFDIDWARRRELAGRPSPLLSELPEVRAAQAVPDEESAKSYSNRSEG